MTFSKDEIDQMWHDWFTVDAFSVEKVITNTYRLLPHDPRCKICASPFEGFGGGSNALGFWQRSIRAQSAILQHM